jgi:hypothetical protein
MIYAETPTRRARQLVADLLALAWISTWIWLSVQAYGWVGRLAAIGVKIENGGKGLEANLTATAEKLHNVPLVGGQVSSPLNRAAGAARSIAAAGQSEQDLAHNLAILFVVVILLGPVALGILLWLPFRIRWALAATTAARLRQHPAGVDLLAMRALTNQPLRRLAALDIDQVTAWRSGQPAAAHALARLELRQLGLRPDPRSRRDRTTPNRRSSTSCQS